MSVGLALAVACSGGSSGGGGRTTSQSVGSAGGTVALQNGASVAIPAGALSATTTITVQEGGTSPSGTTTYLLGPEGTTFAQPVTVTLPNPSGWTEASVFWSKAGSSSEYDALDAVITAGGAQASGTHFSAVFVGTPCHPGVPCTPSLACHNGIWACTSGTGVCSPTTAVADGTACGGTGTCAGGTCSGGCAAAAFDIATGTGEFDERYSCSEGSAPPVCVDPNVHDSVTFAHGSTPGQYTFQSGPNFSGTGTLCGKTFKWTAKYTGFGSGYVEGGSWEFADADHFTSPTSSTYTYDAGGGGICRTSGTRKTVGLAPSPGPVGACP